MVEADPYTWRLTDCFSYSPSKRRLSCGRIFEEEDKIDEEEGVRRWVGVSVVPKMLLRLRLALDIFLVGEEFEFGVMGAFSGAGTADDVEGMAGAELTPRPADGELRPSKAPSKRRLSRGRTRPSDATAALPIALGVPANADVDALSDASRRMTTEREGEEDSLALPYVERLIDSKEEEPEKARLSLGL